MESNVSLFSSETVKYKKKIVFNAGVETSLEYAEPSSNRVPQIQLLFSPFGIPFVPIEILGTNIGSILQSLEWVKDRSNPGGILSFEIAPSEEVIQEIVDVLNKVSGNLYSKIWGELGVDIEDLFKPMTLCQLWMDGYHVMTGCVRSCVQSTSVGNEEKTKTYNIIADELGNLYNQNIVSLRTMILDAIQANLSDSVWKPLEAVSNVYGIPLADGITALCNAFSLTTLSQFVKFSDGFPLSLRMLSLPNPVGGIANLSFARSMIVDSNLFMTAAGQSFWEYMKNFIPTPFMEFFTESGGRTMVTDPIGIPSVLFPGFNYIVARGVPYTNPLIGTVNPAHLGTVLPFDLTVIQMLIGGDFIIITDDDITQKSLGFDSTNQSTMFTATYTSGGVANAPDLDAKPIHSIGPLNPFASGGIPTFGMREMEQNINCTNLVGGGTTLSYAERLIKNKISTTLAMSKPALGNLLATWFRNQSRFREGSVTIKAKAYARAGMYCLYLPSRSGKKADNIRDIGIYYIDSLSHSYALENEEISYTTTLNLIRGVPLPTSVAQTALLLFDFEILPPESGLFDGEYTALKILRQARGGV
jgi:hypothetical protein